MSKADEMFEDLGYEKREGWYNEKDIQYTKRSKSGHRFKEIYFDVDEEVIFFDEESPISVKDLQAINEKVKELGWLNE